MTAGLCLLTFETAAAQGGCVRAGAVPEGEDWRWTAAESVHT